MPFSRQAHGRLPKKHHLQLRTDDGQLAFEECITHQGFEGPYTIAYHTHAPHTQAVARAPQGWPRPVAASESLLAKRHFQTGGLTTAATPLQARVPLLFNADVVLSVAKPTEADPSYFNNADGDTLFYIHEGEGMLRSVLGDLTYGPQDYVYVPRGLLHRMMPQAGSAQFWLCMELRHGLHLPTQWRNEVGQLRMDAPYSHRDFRRVEFVGPMDEGIRQWVVKRGDVFHGFTAQHSPLDVIGWDGSVYPWVFPILNFQPRAGLVHLPPTWHGTFATQGALICSFVPRLVDFHPEAIPCPYPHSSVDMDEFIFYCRGNFTSRKGVGPGSISLHPAGVPHGPHPGAYEASIGTRETKELAVMLDTALPLQPTAQALAVEDAGYQASFIGIS